MDFIDYKVDVTRSVQSTDTRCGAACCVTTLAHYGASITEDEADLEIRAAEVEPDAWYADPQGVSACLDKMRTPDPISFPVSVFETEDVLKAYGHILQTITVQNMPCVTLVYEGSHWVVVNQVRVLRRDGTTTVAGFGVVDPYESEPDWRFVPAPAFAKKYFQPCSFGNRWLNKFVAVGNTSTLPDSVGLYAPPLLPPTPPTGAHLEANGARWLDVPGGRFKAASEIPNDLGLFTSSSVFSVAIETVAQYGFTNVKRHPGGGAPFRNVNVFSLLDDEHYVITSLDAAQDAVLGGDIAVALLLNSGELLELASKPKKDIFSDQKVLDAASALFGAGNYELDEDFYWTRTRLTFSRFSIIRKIRSGNADFFAFPDGQIIDHLPKATRGGGAGREQGWGIRGRELFRA